MREKKEGREKARARASGAGQQPVDEVLWRAAVSLVRGPIIEMEQT